MTTENSPRPRTGGHNSASFDTDHTKFAQQVGAVTPLGDAIDGTPGHPPRRTRRRTAHSAGAVIVGFSCCRCPFRTADQGQYLVHLNAELGALVAEIAEVRSGQPRRADGRRLIALCGTESGYLRHLRRGEPTCAACRAANAARSAASRRLPGALERRRAYMALPENRERHRARERARYAARKQREGRQ